MRYGRAFISDLNANATGMNSLLTYMKDNWGVIPGWTVHDDRISAAQQIVFKLTTEEGGGNEIYLEYYRADTNALACAVWEGWNATTHVGTNKAGHGHSVINASTYSSGEIVWCGDNNFIAWHYNPQGMTVHHANYQGLIQKLRPDVDTTIRAAINLTFGQLNDHATNDTAGVSYSNYNKVPILRNQANTFNGTGQIYYSHWTFKGRQDFPSPMPGPYRFPGVDDRRVMTGHAVYFDTTFGPRGLLRNGILTASRSKDGEIKIGQIIRVGSREYYAVSPTIVDDTASYRNPWGVYYDTGFCHSILIPLNDPHVFCFMEGE